MGQNYNFCACIRRRNSPFDSGLALPMAKRSQVWENTLSKTENQVFGSSPMQVVCRVTPIKEKVWHRLGRWSSHRQPPPT